MNRKIKVSYLLIGVLILILGVYVVYSGGMRIFDYWEVGVGQELQTKAEEMFLPNLLYQPGEESTSLSEWLADQGSQVSPLGKYVSSSMEAESQIEDDETISMILAQQAQDENEVDENGNLIGEEDQAVAVASNEAMIDASLDKLQDFDYLISNFYTVDSSTMISSEDLPVEEMLTKDMTIDKESDGPKVLIFHTHSQEAFADSEPGNTDHTIVGAGAYLAKLLNEEYGIETLHHQGVYDLIGGKLDRSVAYELAQPEIEAILEENPSIEVVIDLHRDGVAETTHLVTEVNGKQTAKIMFFNGMSRTRTNGDIEYLSNPYLSDNLAFSLQMQLAAGEKYPGFTRHIYLKAYRYNMQLAPKMLLIEAGAQSNTVEEEKNAMEPLAEILHSVLTK